MSDHEVKIRQIVDSDSFQLALTEVSRLMTVAALGLFAMSSGSSDSWLQEHLPKLFANGVRETIPLASHASNYLASFYIILALTPLATARVKDKLPSFLELNFLTTLLLCMVIQIIAESPLVYKNGNPEFNKDVMFGMVGAVASYRALRYSGFIDEWLQSNRAKK